MTSRGTVRVLLVFVSFPDDETPHPYWPLHQPPLFMDRFLDPDTGRTSQDPFNLTHYFRQMSLGQLRLIGDAVWLETAHSQAEYSNGSFGRANWSVLQERVDSLVDFSRYDRWTRRADFVHEEAPDGIVDMILMVWRTTIFPFVGEASLGRKPAIVADGKRIEMGYPGSYPDTAGSGLTCEYLPTDDPVTAMRTMAHELGHWLLGAPHPYNNDQLADHHEYWGMLCSGNRRSSCANAYERERLGWIAIPEVIPGQTVRLPDFVSTGAALKFHPAGGDPAEWIYLENHQQVSAFDDVTLNPVDKGVWILHQQGPYLELNNLKIVPSDGRWNWSELGFSSACYGTPVQVFGRGSPAASLGQSHRDMVSATASAVNWMMTYRDPLGATRCGAFFAGESFRGAFTPFSDSSVAPEIPPPYGGSRLDLSGSASVFSPYSNPSSCTWSGQPTGFSLEVLSDSSGVCTLRCSADPLAASPARRFLGIPPGAPESQPGRLGLAWGAQWPGGQPMEPDVHWSELERRVDTTGIWTPVYEGPATTWSDSLLPYDQQGIGLVTYRARVRDEGGRYSAWSNLFTARLAVSTALADRGSAALPVRLRLEPNFPNPFNPSTVIRFSLPARALVHLTVSDLLGREVRRLIHQDLPAGWHTAAWDGTDTKGVPVSSGIYICRISAGSQTAAEKMLLSR